ncbi:MAG: hypothetical protein IJX17_04780 [Clostridia bacterium]|nr:hypothetical protein [Clostridia bacterium]
MEKSHKKNISHVVSKSLKCLMSFMIIFVSLVLVACGSSSSAYDYYFDANKKYRLNKVSIMYYETTSGGLQNEYTGSFLIPMEYYCNKDYGTMVGKAGTNSNTFDRSFDQSGSRAFYHLSLNGSNPWGSDFVNVLTYPDYTFMISGNLYQVHVSVDTSKLQIVGANPSNENPTYYTRANYIKATDSLDKVFSFAFRKGVTGNWIDANQFIRVVYMQENNVGGAYSYDVTTDQNKSYDGTFYMLFNPQLDKGTTKRTIRVRATPNFGQNIKYVYDDSVGGVVVKNGASTIKPTDAAYANFISKTILPLDEARGNSQFSSPIEFNAYKMSFTSYSVNSSTLDYGNISYNTHKYYFNTVEQTYSLTKNKYYTTSFTGYFPAGRIVEVTQNMEDPTSTSVVPNYAFQSWTANKKATNSLILKDSLTANQLSKINAAVDTSAEYTLYEKFGSGYTCIFGNKFSKYYAVEARTSAPANSSDTLHSIINTSGSRTHTIKIGSAEKYNNCNFYANYVRVHNFSLSGSLFNAESIVGNNSSKLEGVKYTVYNAKNQPLRSDIAISGFEFTISNLNFGDYVEFSKTEGDLPFKFYGSHMSPFMSSNGTITHKVLRNHVENSNNLFATAVSDYSGKTVYIPAGESEFVFNNKTYYVNDGVVTDETKKTYTTFMVNYAYQNMDITETPVLATKYDAESSLVVNVFAYDAGKIIDPVDNRISYEIIESVDSYIDASGFITTTVYVSVVLPDNQTIQAYNVITDNSTKPTIYSNFNGYEDGDCSSDDDAYDYNTYDMNSSYWNYKTDSGYAKFKFTNLLLEKTEIENNETKHSYFMMNIEENVTGVSKSANTTLLTYKGEHYLYAYKSDYAYTTLNNHKTSGVNKIYTSVSSYNIIALKSNGKYDLIELEKINHSSDSNNANYLNKTSYRDPDDTSGISQMDMIEFNGYLYLNSSIEKRDGEHKYDAAGFSSVQLTFPYVEIHKSEAIYYESYYSKNGLNPSINYYDKEFSTVINTTAKPNSIVTGLAGNNPTISPNYNNNDKQSLGNGIVVSKLAGTELFFNAQITKELDVKSKSMSFNMKEIALKTIYMTKVTDTKYEKSLTYYRFFYNNIEYYYYEDSSDDPGEGDFYRQYSYDLFQFLDEDIICKKFFGYTVSVNTKDEEIDITKRYLDHNSQVFYYDEINNTFHNDRYCVSNKIDFVELFGYKPEIATQSASTCSHCGKQHIIKTSKIEYSVNSSQNKVSFTRLYIHANGKDYFIKSNASGVYIDKNCYQLLSSDDDYVINGNKVVFSCTYRTYLRFSVKGATGNTANRCIVDNSLAICDESTLKPVRDFVYYNYSVDKTNKKVNFYYGSTNETYHLRTRDGEDVLSSGTMAGIHDWDAGDSLSCIRLEAGYRGSLLSVKYFGASSTSVIAQGYKTDMQITAYNVNGNFYYLSDDKLNNAETIGEYTFTNSVYTDSSFAISSVFPNMMVERGSKANNESDTAYLFDTSLNLASKSANFAIYNYYTSAPAIEGYKMDATYLMVYSKSRKDYYNGVRTPLNAVTEEAIPNYQDYLYFEDDGTFYIKKSGVSDGNKRGNQVKTFYQRVEKKEGENTIVTLEKITKDRDLPKGYKDTDDDIDFVYFDESYILKLDQFNNYDYIRKSYNNDSGAFVIDDEDYIPYNLEALNKFSAKKQTENYYAYFDVESYTIKKDNDNKKYNFFTSPLAQVYEVINELGDKEQQFTYAFTISNFFQLINEKKIVKGSDIATKAKNLGTSYSTMSDSDLNYALFYKILGPKLLDNCYYYIPALGAIETINVYQENELPMSNFVLVSTVKYNYKSNNAPYDGEVDSVEIKNFSSHFTNINGITIDDLSGRLDRTPFTLNVTHNYSKSPVEITAEYNGQTYYIKTNANKSNTEIGKDTELYRADLSSADTKVYLFKDPGFKTFSQYTATASGDINKIYLNHMSFYQGTKEGTLYSYDESLKLNIEGSTNIGENGYATVHNLNKDNLPNNLSKVFEDTKFLFNNTLYTLMPTRHKLTESSYYTPEGSSVKLDHVYILLNYTISIRYKNSFQTTNMYVLSLQHKDLYGGSNGTYDAYIFIPNGTAKKDGVVYTSLTPIIKNDDRDGVKYLTYKDLYRTITGNAYTNTQYIFGQFIENQYGGSNAPVESIHNFNYIFRYNNEYYYANGDSGKVYKTTSLVSNPTETNLSSYLVSDYKFDILTSKINRIVGENTELIAHINKTENGVAIGSTNVKAVKYVYDSISGKIYYYGVNSLLYSNLSYSENEFVLSSYKTLNAFIDSTTSQIVLRPNYEYYTFTNFKAICYTFENDTIPTDANIEYLPSINDNVYPKYIKNGELITTSTMKAVSETKYYEKGTTNELRLSIQDEVLELGQAARYATSGSATGTIAILGKSSLTGSATTNKAFPSYSKLLVDSSIEALLDVNAYFPADYTSKSNVTEGFPGVTIIDGIPYTNQMFVFEVKHRQGETSIVDLSIMVNNGYYVELLTNAVNKNGNDESTGMQIISDFSSVTFKDTLENLLVNDYVDNIYYVVDNVTFRPFESFIKIDGYVSSPSAGKLAFGGKTITHVTYNDYYLKYHSFNTNDPTQLELRDEYINTVFITVFEYMELTDKEKTSFYGYILDSEKEGAGVYKLFNSFLKITDCKTNEETTDSNIYFDGYKKYSEEYNKDIYYKPIYRLVSGDFTRVTDDDVAIWKSNASILTDIPYYDIHTFRQDEETGLIYLSSDIVSEDDNFICEGLEGLTVDVTSPSSDVNYDNLTLAGLTTAYKVKSSELDKANFQGYWFDYAISISDNAAASSVYLECGVDSVVMLANPLISFDGEVYYRFKEWKIFSRENSEYIYYDKGVTESTSFKDRFNPICRFSSEDAGYFLFLPVYEKIYQISITTEVISGAINTGGSINISSEAPSISIDEKDHSDDYYFIEYTNTNEDSYYYAPIKTFPYLYYTGNKYNGMPIYQRLGMAEDAETNPNSVSYVLMYYESTVKNRGLLGFLFDFLDKQEYCYIVKFEGTKQTDIQRIPVKKKVDSNDPNPCLIAVTNNKSGSYIINGRYVNYQDLVFRSYYSIYPVTSNKNKFIMYDVDEQNENYSPITEVLSYSMATERVSSGGVSKKQRVIYHNKNYYIIKDDNFTTSPFYKLAARIINLFIDDPNQKLNTDFDLDLKKIIAGNNKIATSVVKTSNVATVNKDVYNGEYYTNSSNNLATGELYYDKNGTVYSTLQYKDNYYDRDTSVILTAIANNGYRFEGWYPVTFDEIYGWQVSDKDITQLYKTTYSNEIVKTQFVAEPAVKYYRTNYVGYNPNGTTYEIGYQISSNLGVSAIFERTGQEIPDSIREEYCGIFVNLGASREEPRFVRVYTNSSTSNGTYPDIFYDEDCMYQVSLSDFAISYNNFADLWNQNYIGYMNISDTITTEYTYNDNGKIDLSYSTVSTNSFVFNNTKFISNGDEVYAVYTYDNELQNYTVSYFKTKIGGNYRVENNKLYINNLHKNIKLVAKFIETYQVYVFNELE